MYCIKCGHELKENEKYCPNCGFKVETSSADNLAAATAISMPSTVQQTAVQKSSHNKSKVTAALLAIFLGSLGVHNFYLGRIKYAIGQLILTILGGLISLILMILFLLERIDPNLYVVAIHFPNIISSAVGIWALIDFILILCNKLKPGNNFSIN